MIDDGTDVGSKPLVFRGRLTEDDVVDIQWCVDRLMVRRSVRWLACGTVTLVVVLLLAALGTGLSMGRGTPPKPAIAITLAMLIFWVYLLFLLPRERNWQARKFYRKHADAYIETQVTLSDESVAIENDDMSSEFRWNLVGLVVDVPKGLMFCNTVRQTLIWLPSRLLDADGMREQVLSLAGANGVRVQRTV